MKMLLSAVCVLALGSLAQAQRPVPTLKMGVEVTGDMAKLPFTVTYRNDRSGFTYCPFGTYFGVNLKAKQGITVSATVVGKNREVAMMLLDPTGKEVEKSQATIRSNQLTFEEVSATGTYRIFVASDAIGPFTITVTDPNAPDETKALESRLQQLETELAEVRAKLQRLRNKSNNK